MGIYWTIVFSIDTGCRWLSSRKFWEEMDRCPDVEMGTFSEALDVFLTRDIVDDDLNKVGEEKIELTADLARKFLALAHVDEQGDDHTAEIAQLLERFPELTATEEPDWMCACPENYYAL